MAESSEKRGILKDKIRSGIHFNRDGSFPLGIKALAIRGVKPAKEEDQRYSESLPIAFQRE
jgi:hypothetical protein